jgi:hypothetical protein
MNPTGRAKMANAAKDGDTVIIKKYANRRLYNTRTSSYITLDHLAQNPVLRWSDGLEGAAPWDWSLLSGNPGLP